MEARSPLFREIIRHTQRLANPVCYRHSQQTLLRLRQQNPHIFHEICIYSEVAARLASNTYRIQARRFLQELFLDSSFDALFEEPVAILKMTVNPPESRQSSHVPITQTTVVVSPSLKWSKTGDAKLNGRPTIPSDQQPDHLTIVSEETETPGANSQKSTDGAVHSEAEPRRTDERIIAEILKPEERLRLSRNSEKVLKASGINTAISLD